MPPPIRNVCVAGASGNIGLPITNALVSSGVFNVSALSRSSASSPSTLPTSVNIVHADYDDHAALVAALKGQDAVVCAIDAIGNLSQERLIDAAAEAGVKRFVSSHWAFDHLAEGFRDVAPVWVLKEGPIQRLREKGLPWTAIVTGSWVDFFVKSPAFESWDVKSKTFVRFDDGEQVFDCSSQAQVGHAVVAVLREENLQKTKNQYVYARSGRLTQNKVLEIFQRETKQDWKIVPIEAETVRKQGVALWDRWTKEKGLAIAELGKNEEWRLSVHMIVGGLVMGKWAMWEDKAQWWMKELGLEEEDLDKVLTEATKETIAAAQ